jgi:hypothetical protein
MPYYGYTLRGDGFLGSLVKTVGRIGGGLLGIQPAPRITIPGGTLPQIATPSALPAAVISRIRATKYIGAPPLAPGGAAAQRQYEYEMGRPRRRRMNYGNGKALNRAIRRINGFAGLVKRSKRAISKANTAVGNRPRVTKKTRR